MLAMQQLPLSGNDTGEFQTKEQVDSLDEMNSFQPDDVAADEPTTTQSYESVPAEPVKKEEPQSIIVMPTTPKKNEEFEPKTVMTNTPIEPKNDDPEPTTVMTNTHTAPTTDTLFSAEKVKHGRCMSPSQRPVVCAPTKPSMDAAPRPNYSNQAQRNNTKSAPHELFIGNLPLSMKEEQLKEFFENTFGKVLGVRINRKNHKNKTFGFVKFENQETAKHVLAKKPILLSHDICLVVEEIKRQGDRHGYGTRVRPQPDGQMKNDGTLLGETTKTPTEPKEKDEPESTTVMSNNKKRVNNKKQQGFRYGSEPTNVTTKASTESKEKDDSEPTTVMANTPTAPTNDILSWAEKVKHGRRMSPPQRPVVCAPTKPSMDAAPKVHEKPRAQAKHASRPKYSNQAQSNNTKSAHELFVGNLPLSMKEEQLKDFFDKKFGKVVGVRINHKNLKNKTFGFVRFKNEDTAKKVLTTKPIMLDNLHLNVEEKKQRGDRHGSRVGPQPDGQMKNGCTLVGETEEGHGRWGRRANVQNMNSRVGGKGVHRDGHEKNDKRLTDSGDERGLRKKHGQPQKDAAPVQAAQDRKPTVDEDGFVLVQHGKKKR